MGKTLEGIIAAKPSGISLLHDLERMKEKAEPLLSQIPRTFPEFTEHGANHSKRIIENGVQIFKLLQTLFLKDI